MRPSQISRCQDAEAAFATAEVLLRTEGDAHEQEEALVAAKAFLEGEGMPEEVLEDWQIWRALLKSEFKLPRVQVHIGGQNCTPSYKVHSALNLPGQPNGMI